MGMVGGMSKPAREFRVGLMHMLAEGPFETLVQGILRYAEYAQHWRLLGKPYWPFVSLEELDREQVDGVIGNVHQEQWFEPLLRSGVRVVTTSNRFAEMTLPRVASDEEAIGRMGAEHLMACGFTQFGYVGVAHLWFSGQRGDAFQRAIRAAGRTCYACPVVSFGDRTSADTVREWLARLPKPIAVLAAVDHFGAHVIDAAAALGLRVPEDVAVLGVDNDWRTTAMTHPPMSSIRSDAMQVGYRAAKMLDELMRGQTPESPQWVPPVAVVRRRSTDIELSDDPLVRDALGFIRDCSANGITVEDVLEELDVSRRTLENRMKRAIGQTPQVAIQQAQIKRAKTILQGSRENLGAVARASGFERQDQFCTVFKRLTGMTPGEYRRRFAEPFDDTGAANVSPE